MEQRAEALQRSTTDFKQKDDAVAAKAARQEAVRWAQKAEAAQLQLQEVGKVLAQKRGVVAGCERQAPSLLRGEEQQGLHHPLLCFIGGPQGLCAWADQKIPLDTSDTDISR